MFTPKPYDDELLSSWFIRVARKNHTNISTIICHIFKNNVLSEHTKKLHIKDLDLYLFNDTQKNTLLKMTNVSIESLQLFKYIGYLDEKIDRYNKKWITEPKTAIQYTKKIYGTRFCPKCLEEHAYIKQLWRVMLYNICLEHNCYLLSQCPTCDAKFMYNDNGYTRELYQCYNCNFDLRTSNTLVSNTKHINYQNKLLNILNCGYYKLNNRFYYSISLFIILKKLLHTVMRVNNIQVKYINQLKPVQLSRLISHVLFLLESFPYRLNKYYENHQLTNITNILAWDERNKETCKLPSWYMSGITYKVITFKGKKTTGF